MNELPLEQNTSPSNASSPTDSLDESVNNQITSDSDKSSVYQYFAHYHYPQSEQVLNKLSSFYQTNSDLPDTEACNPSREGGIIPITDSLPTRGVGTNESLTDDLVPVLYVPESKYSAGFLPQGSNDDREEDDDDNSSSGISSDFSNSLVSGGGAEMASYDNLSNVSYNSRSMEVDALALDGVVFDSGGSSSLMLEDDDFGDSMKEQDLGTPVERLLRRSDCTNSKAR